MVVSPPKEMEMEEVVLFLLPEVLEDVMQVNQLKVDSSTVQG